MAWPRIKNSRSSAQPGTQPHDGVQATVTPAADAEPPPRSSQNTGVIGTTYAVAENPVQDARSPRHDRSASRRLGPIRSAHSGVDDPIRYAHSGGDEAPAPEDAEEAEEAEAPEAAMPGQSAEPADDGISIFGDMATTEVPDEPEPTMDFRRPHRSPAVEPPATGSEPAAAGPTDPIPVGGSWNRTVTSSVPPAEPATDSKPGPFGIRGGGRRPAAAARDGQPRVSVRDLPPDVQVRFWRTRAIIMIVVGLLFGILTKNWVIGLSLAILAGIIDTLYRSRNAADHQNGASQGGAQKRTRRQLKRLRRDGYFALDARPIPDTREFIDHLIIGPTGVYAIDSEKWNSKVPVRTLNGKRLYRGPESQKERLEHAAWEAGQASEILSAALGTEISVRPALAIYGPRIPWDIATIRNVDVFSGPTLRKYLRRRARQREGAPKLTREEVRTIYDTAARMLPDVAPTRTVAPVG
jgi:Nuclease-related domain